MTVASSDGHPVALLRVVPRTRARRRRSGLRTIRRGPRVGPTWAGGLQAEPQRIDDLAGLFAWLGWRRSPGLSDENDTVIEEPRRRRTASRNCGQSPENGL